MLLERFGYEQSADDVHRWVCHTQDRPFNDHRYAVDGSKLIKLGWTQKTSFEDGLRITTDWYRRFGNSWWGDISSRLAPFPTAPADEEAGQT